MDVARRVPIHGFPVTGVQTGEKPGAAAVHSGVPIRCVEGGITEKINLSAWRFADEGLGDLMPYDCVFLCDVPRFGLAEVRRLENHVRRGGSVVFCLGPNVDRASYNDMLYSAGKGLLPARLSAGASDYPPLRDDSLVPAKDTQRTALRPLSVST